MSGHDRSNEALRDLAQRYNKHGRSRDVEDAWLDYWARRCPELEALLLLHLRLKDHSVEEVRKTYPPPSSTGVSPIQFLPDVIAVAVSIGLVLICTYRWGTWYAYAAVAAIGGWLLLQLVKGYRARWNQLMLYMSGVPLLSTTAVGKIFGYFETENEVGDFFLAMNPDTSTETVVRLVMGTLLVLAGWRAGEPKP